MFLWVVPSGRTAIRGTAGLAKAKNCGDIASTKQHLENRLLEFKLAGSPAVALGFCGHAMEHKHDPLVKTTTMHHDLHK